MNPFLILNKYHNSHSKTYEILTIHSVLVANLALKIAQKFPKANQHFIYESALLHDIGFNFPDFKSPLISEEQKAKLKTSYISHGYWGYLILKQEDLLKHANIAKNHIGVGIFSKEITLNHWPLPLADYFPQSLEEEIVSFADLFYSKDENQLFKKATPKEIEEEINHYQFKEEKLKIFKNWLKKFNH